MESNNKEKLYPQPIDRPEIYERKQLLRKKLEESCRRANVDLTRPEVKEALYNEIILLKSLSEEKDKLNRELEIELGILSNLRDKNKLFGNNRGDTLIISKHISNITILEAKIAGLHTFKMQRKHETRIHLMEAKISYTAVESALDLYELRNLRGEEMTIRNMPAGMTVKDLNEYMCDVAEDIIYNRHT